MPVPLFASDSGYCGYAILWAEIGGWSVGNFRLPSNMLESAKARRKNVPACAAQQQRTLVI